MREMKEGSARAGVVIAIVTAALGCSPAELVEAGPIEVTDTQPVVSVRDSEALVAWHRGSGSRKIHVSSFVTGSAVPGWSTPVVVRNGEGPEVALSRSGRAFVVYSNFATGVRAAVRSAGVWAPETTLDPSDHEVSVAADAGGNGIAAWANPEVKASVYLAGVGWQPAVTVGTPAQRVEVAMNDAGSGVAAWCDGGVIRAARYLPASGWQAPTGSSSNCCTNTWDLLGLGFHVGIAETGDIFTLGANGTRVCARRYAAGIGWGPTVILGTGVVKQPALAVNMAGSAFAAWLDDGTVKTRAYLAGAGWQPVLSADSGVPDGPIGVGMGSSGYAAVVYGKGGPIKDMYYATWNKATLQAPALMESLAGTAYYLDVGFDPNAPSKGVTVWQHAGAGAINEEIRASSIGL